MTETKTSLEILLQFCLYKNAKLPQNQTGRRGVRAKKENEQVTIVFSRSVQNLELGYFMLFCRERQRHVPKFKTHLQKRLFFLVKLMVLRRSRCRRCLSQI